jgi:hypothetical protein
MHAASTVDDKRAMIGLANRPETYGLQPISEFQLYYEVYVLLLCSVMIHPIVRAVGRCSGA